MIPESRYLDVKGPWSYGISYQLNDYMSFATEYLYGSQVSVTAKIGVNPARPPVLGGKELAPVPMRLRGANAPLLTENNETVIRRVLKADRFNIHHLKFESDSVTVVVTNTKFRSTAQALGRVASTLQRFSSDYVKFANISFYSKNLQTASYRVDLEQIIEEQFEPKLTAEDSKSILTIDADIQKFENNKLNTVCKNLRIPLNHHDALSDAKGCALIAIEAFKKGYFI